MTAIPELSRRAFLSLTAVGVTAPAILRGTALAAEPVTAQTASGALRGFRNQGALTFLGVPYAADTAGENRFRAPRPVPAWEGERDATSYGPLAPQVPSTLGRDDPTFEWYYQDQPQGEDCLVLNIFTPDLDPDARRPVMFYIHGGGWIMFSLKTHGRLMREYAARAGICVIGIDYSYAPEQQFPTQIEESMAAVRWANENSADLGIDPDQLAIGGDSAGANLSLATAAALAASDNNPGLKGLILNYGAFNSRCEGESYGLFGDGKYMLDLDEMISFWRLYLGDPSVASDSPYIFDPLRSDLSSLPPVLMAIADHDILVDDSLLLRDRLMASDIPVKAEVYPGTVHGFLEAIIFGGAAVQALDDAADWLSALFQK